LELIEADVAYDVIEILKERLKKELLGFKVSRFGDLRQAVFERIKEIIYNILREGVYDKDFIKLIRVSKKPFVIVFLGVNGVGKTTTIAKIAYLLRKHRFSVVTVAADTFRAGAQEQLRIHAMRLGIPIISGKYGADPAAVALDGVNYARANRLDTVLIDTAGRMHTDIDLVNELRKIVRVVNPDMKILVLDALTGNDALEQTKFFDEAVGVDAVVLTKVDADVKGGPVLTTIVGVGKPILFLGVGQRYDDLEPYVPSKVLSKILG